MKLSLDCFFLISNDIRKYWKLWTILACNIVLKNDLKIRFPCIEVFLATQYQEQTNVVTFTIFLPKRNLVFLWIVMSLLFLNLSWYKHNLWEKWVAFLIFLFNSFGILCGLLGLVLHFWINSSGNFYFPWSNFYQLLHR